MGADCGCQRLYFVWNTGYYDRGRPGQSSGKERERADLDSVSGRDSEIFTGPLCAGAL